MQVETQQTTAIERFTQNIQQQVDALLEFKPDGSVGCKITAQRDYDSAGENLAAIRKAKKRWASLLKDDPGKKPSECEGVEGVYFFAYQSLERVRKLLNDGLKWFEVRETAYGSAIADYDRRKQEELRRKQEAEEQKRREAALEALRAQQEEERKRREAAEAQLAARRAAFAAQQAKDEESRREAQEKLRQAEEARQKAEAEAAEMRRQQEEADRQQALAYQRQQAIADKAEEVSKGPEGMSRQRRLKVCGVNLREFVPWALRTGNLSLLKVDEGKLNRLINALAGHNIPPGVTTVRADILRTK